MTPPAPSPSLRPPLPLWAAVVVAAVAGLLLDLATPDVGWWPLAFASVILALLTLIGRSIGGALLVGVTYGAVFYLLHLVWVGTFLGPIPRLALTTLETVLFGIWAIPIALAFRWTARFPRRAAVQLIAVPALIAGLWTTREIFLGSWPYTGFPWVRLGMIQVDGPFAEVASWTGVTGLSFLIAMLCAAVLQAARSGRPPRIRGFLPAGVIALVLLVLPQFPTTDAGSMRIGWVQGNGPAGYFDDRAPGDMLAAQTAATEPLLGQPMDLLVWPEGSVDSDPLNDPRTAAALDALTEAAGAPLLANAATTRGEDTFNTSLLWPGGTGEPQLHDKVNPVPFGERVPDRWFYEAIVPDLVGLIQREYTPGTNTPLVTLGDIGIGLAICFDVIYDAVVWEGARNGAQLYVFQTNNGDFRGTDENLQQLSFARMRAIETGRAVVNVSTVGTSQVIAPDGSTITGIAVDTADARITAVPLRTGLTPASVLGPWVTALIAAGSVVALAVLGLLRRAGHRALARRERTAE